MRKSFKVYDMSDNKKLYDVIALSAAHAIGIVENTFNMSPDHLVVCDAGNIPITNPHDEVLSA